VAISFDKLTIKNFGPYYGEHSIDLTVSESAPVVVIFGENTLGKSQLFSALRWCLYGAFAPHQAPEAVAQELPMRLNVPAKLRGDLDLEVSVAFSVSGSTYHLTRHARFFADGSRFSVKPDLRIDASVVPESSIEIEIGRVLHPQISEFFLFDAELLETFYERLDTDRERALIRSSIETVLGIPGLQLAQRDVSELANDAMTRQAKLIENRRQSEAIASRIRELESEAKSIEADRHELTLQLDSGEAELREVSAKLKTLEGLQADIRELEGLEASLADGQANEVEILRGMRRLLASGWRSPASVVLGRTLSRVQDRNSAVNEKNQIIATARTRVTVLEDRAKGGVCPTCEQLLPPPGPETEAELETAKGELSALLAETGGGQLDLELERRVGALIDETTIPKYVDLYRQLSRVRMMQYERGRGQAEIRDRMQGHSAATVRTVVERARALESGISVLRAAEAKNARRADTLAKEQTKLTRELQRLPGSAGSTVALETAFYRYVRDLLSQSVDEFREDVRFRVEADAQKLFLQLIRDPEGYGGLTISADYQIELLDPRGNSRQTSQGGKQLLALSLIGALKRAAIRGGPVVLDSPLGRLDLEHRANVLREWIPALGGQTVLLVQSGELTMEDARTILGNLVGRTYQIVRPSNDPEVAVIEAVN